MSLRIARPSDGQFAAAVLAGLVFGALGGGFAAALQLSLLAIIAVGVWQGVTLLTVIADHTDIAQTAPVRRR